MRRATTRTLLALAVIYAAMMSSGARADDQGASDPARLPARYQLLAGAQSPHEVGWRRVGEDAVETVIALDIEYQAAVERGDAQQTMARILADDFVLVTGAGKRFTKSDLIEEARAGKTIYEVQRAGERSAKAWGNTAVVTALLHAKGTSDGKPFEYRVWYSDTYVRFASGWQYVFGQSSLPLPAAAPK